ncbi:hypothetical protein PGTUg99_001930 [Puccinia graminis f. sp. tritici]|uniref:Uncharacterized protein n=1 Tax=Puccinia graminis f. sp. tritici TaxID=56615 RepID=A0A5B0MLM6_PUCGR|nr:hypothetical protein PGTUg99_001930 [Puccinia graminis f. sp. tritici]
MQSDSGQSSLFTNPSAFDPRAGIRINSNGQLSTTMRLSSTLLYPPVNSPRLALVEQSHPLTPRLSQGGLHRGICPPVPLPGRSTTINTIDELELECAKLLQTFNNNQQQGQAGLGSPMLSGSSTNATGLRKPMVLSDDALARLQSSLRPISFLAPLLNPRSFKPKTTAPPPTLAPLLSLHKRKNC